TAMNDFTQRSAYFQIGVGAGSGFLTGYVLLKVSKLAAIAAGGTILIIELGLQAGVVKLDIFKILSEPSTNEQHLNGSNLLNIEKLVQKASSICTTSGRIYVAFVGGFLLGFGWA
ncbi:hypothetical protein KR009_003824, partial [Drosophila setifemur]